MIYRETDAWQRFAAAALGGIVTRSGGDPEGVAGSAANYADAMWQKMQNRDSRAVRERKERQAQRSTDEERRLGAFQGQGVVGEP